MADKKLILSSLDNNHVIIDLGLTHTKVGFAKDPTPMHIVPTPLPLVQAVRDNLTDVSFAELILIVEHHDLRACI